MIKIDFPQKPLAFLVYFIKTLTVWQKWSIFFLLFITAAVVISNFIMFYGFKLLVDNVPTSDPHDVWATLSTPLWIIIGCCIFHTIFYRVRDIIDAQSTPYIMNALRELVVSNITRHSHDYFHNRFSGELVNKVNNLIAAYRTILWERLLHGLIPTFSAIFSSFVLLWMMDKMLAMAFLGVILCMLSSVRLMARSLGRASSSLADREADISGQLVDTVTNIASVKNFARHAHEINLLQRFHVPYVVAYKRFVLWEIIFWGVFDIFICIMVIGMVVYLITNWADGHLTTGDLAVAILIGWDVWYRMAHLSWQLTQVSADFGKMSSALNDFVRPIGIEDSANASTMTVRHGAIEFRDVAFSYDSGARIFTNFSLSIPASQKIGIVGLSGAGKTTLCQLLLRNYDVQAGYITIDNQNIAMVTQDSVRQSVAVIPQDPSLFHRSLFDNILYGRPDATEDEVIAAAKAAQAHDFIITTPEGYNTMVGERGVKLSGGQRQRIAIARAILKNAPILILDEATSALDSDTERHIQSALNAAMEGRTTLVVAHRLSTLAHLDRIIVMKDGAIVEDGTLYTLIAQGGHFAYLWNLQAGGFLPEKI